LLLCCLAAACGTGTDANKDGIADGIRTPDSVSQVAPSTPVGSLSGQVLGTDFKGLDGVKVTVIVGGIADADGVAFEGTTDNQGIWSVKGLPAAASAQVLFTKTDYATARINAVVPGAAGNFPVNNGNGNLGTILLTALKDSVKFQVITASGRPAGMVKCMLEVTPAAVRYSDFSASYGSGVGVFVAEATTEPNGIVTFTGVPALAEQARLNGNFAVTIGAIDEDMNGRPEYLGTRRDFPARDLFQGTISTVITLSKAAAFGPVRVIASNVDSMVNGAGDPLKSMVKTGESLYFVFDQAVVEASIGVKVTDETGLQTVTSMKMLIAPNILQVTLSPAGENGREYNVALRATSAENGSTLSQAAYFFVGDPAMPKPFAIERVTYKRPALNMSTATRLELGDRVIVVFNQPIRLVAGQNVEVLIDYDINNMNGKGDVPGEKSPPGATMQQTNGFVTLPNEPIAEPMSTFANLASGYTTRYEFTYGAPGTVTVPTGTSFTLFFSEIPSSLNGYRTLWGTGVEADAVGVLSAPP
jgi:hypothetical protein